MVVPLECGAAFVENGRVSALFTFMMGTNLECGAVFVENGRRRGGVTVMTDAAALATPRGLRRARSCGAPTNQRRFAGICDQ